MPAVRRSCSPKSSADHKETGYNRSPGKHKEMRNSLWRRIVLRMVAKLASYVDYYNNAGINTLIMKI